MGKSKSSFRASLTVEGQRNKTVNHNVSTRAEAMIRIDAVLLPV